MRKAPDGPSSALPLCSVILATASLPILYLRDPGTSWPQDCPGIGGATQLYGQILPRRRWFLCHGHCAAGVHGHLGYLLTRFHATVPINHCSCSWATVEWGLLIYQKVRCPWNKENSRGQWKGQGTVERDERHGFVVPGYGLAFLGQYNTGCLLLVIATKWHITSSFILGSLLQKGKGWMAHSGKKAARKRGWLVGPPDPTESPVSETLTVIPL